MYDNDDSVIRKNRTGEYRSQTVSQRHTVILSARVAGHPATRIRRATVGKTKLPLANSFRPGLFLEKRGRLSAPNLERVGHAAHACHETYLANLTIFSQVARRMVQPLTAPHMQWPTKDYYASLCQNLAF